MAIVLLTNLVKVPFHHFFNVISTKIFQLMSSGMDSVNNKLQNFSMTEIGNMLQMQMLMVSFKELYSYLVKAGLIFFILLFSTNTHTFPGRLNIREGRQF